jgi:hypothetical protein
MCGRGLCVAAGRLYHPPTLRTGLRSLVANHRPAVNAPATGIRSQREISYGYGPASFPSIPMATRMLHSTKATNGEKHNTVDEVNDHENHSHNHNHTTAHDHTHDHDHEDHNHGHNHSHSHGIFGAFGHAHSREDTTTAGAEKIVEALKGGSASRRLSAKVPMMTWHKPCRRRPRKSNNACRIICQHRPDRHQRPGGVVHGMFADYKFV